MQNLQTNHVQRSNLIVTRTQVYGKTAVGDDRGSILVLVRCWNEKRHRWNSNGFHRPANGSVASGRRHRAAGRLLRSTQTPHGIMSHGHCGTVISMVSRRSVGHQLIEIRQSRWPVPLISDVADAGLGLVGFVKEPEDSVVARLELTLVDTHSVQLQDRSAALERDPEGDSRHRHEARGVAALGGTLARLPRLSDVSSV